MRTRATKALSLLLVLGITALSAAGIASADDPTVTSEGTIPYPVYVQNSYGMPLAGVNLVQRATGQSLGLSDGGGVATYEAPYQCFSTGACGTSFDAIYGSRSDGSGDPCGTAPDAWPAGQVIWRAGDTPNAIGGYTKDGVITLAPLPGSPFQPALSDEERGLLGVINRSRAEDGLAPLTISATLTASADKYLGSIPARKLDYGQDAIYCENSGPGIRAADAGFPTSEDIGESVLQGDGNAAAAFADLQNDPHQDALENGAATLIGIAQEGGTWVLDTSDLQTNAPYYGRAGDTGDVGDPSLVVAEFPASPSPSADPTQVPGPTARRDPHLRISRVKVAASTVRVAVSLSAKAAGSVRVEATRLGPSARRVVLDLTRNGAQALASGRLSPGRWVIKARFVPRAGTSWRPDGASRRLLVPRSPGQDNK